MDARRLDAYCEECGDMTVHEIGDDPTSCACSVCGHTQVLMSP